MSRAQLEVLASFLLVLYLVTHGVSVPRESRADLVSGSYHSILAWLRSLAGRLSALFKLGARPLQA